MIDTLTTPPQTAHRRRTAQGLYAAFHALLNHGDEAVLLEPAFDIYSAQIKMAGGKCVYVPLRPPDASSPKSWHLDWDEFERAFTEKTRVVVLNTPHNPTGKARCLESGSPVVILA